MACYVRRCMLCLSRIERLQVVFLLGCIGLTLSRLCPRHQAVCGREPWVMGPWYLFTTIRNDFANTKKLFRNVVIITIRNIGEMRWMIRNGCGRC